MGTALTYARRYSLFALVGIAGEDDVAGAFLRDCGIARVETIDALIEGLPLVARLPLVPNKDIVFANLAVFLVGNDAAVTRLVALTVALTLLCHVIVFALTWLPLRKGAAA